MLCVLAQALIAALRTRLPGYATVTPDVIQRRFLETPGQQFRALLRARRGSRRFRVGLRCRGAGHERELSNAPWTSSARWATPSPSTPWRQPGKGESSRQIITTGDTITVRLDRRAYSPVLRQADLPATTVPWWGNRA